MSLSTYQRGKLFQAKREGIEQRKLAVHAYITDRRRRSKWGKFMAWLDRLVNLPEEEGGGR